MHEGNGQHPLGELEQKATHNPNSLPDVWNLADAYADHELWQKAVGTYEAALGLSPDNADLHCNLGTVLEEVGNTELAEEAYQKAIAVQPDHATAYYNLGSLNDELGRIPQAVEAFEACLRFSEDPRECSDAREKLRRIEARLKDVEKVVETSTPMLTFDKMLKQIRSWGLWLLALGILHLVLSGLSGPGGVVLLLVGLASFAFREAAMFVVYGTILAWIAISNMLSGQVGWIVAALVQLVMTFAVFRQYVGFRRAEKELDSLPGPQRASRAFPLIGCGLGALAFGGLVMVFATGIFLALAETTGVARLLMWLENLLVHLAVLGLATALASLLSGYRHKVLAILGIIACALVLLLELGFALVSLLGG